MLQAGFDRRGARACWSSLRAKIVFQSADNGTKDDCSTPPATTCSPRPPTRKAGGWPDTANPDLLLVDIRLGEYNGLQLAVRERVNHPNRPVIVMTGHTGRSRRHVAEFIEKPLPPARLIEMIAHMVGTAGNAQLPR